MERRADRSGIASGSDGAGLKELAERAVEAKAWRWMPGMLTLSGLRVGPKGLPKGRHLPDLLDPATLGCIVGILRDESGSSNLCIECYREQWNERWIQLWAVSASGSAQHYVEDMHGFSTEADAAVTALEVAHEWTW